MKYFQSHIERLLYFLIILLVIANLSVVLLLTANTSELNAIVRNHTHTIAIETQNTKQIETNQQSNILAIKTYIACLLDLNATQTPAQVKSAGTACFNSTPQVK